MANSDNGEEKAEIDFLKSSYSSDRPVTLATGLIDKLIELSRKHNVSEPIAAEVRRLDTETKRLEGELLQTPLKIHGGWFSLDTIHGFGAGYTREELAKITANEKQFPFKNGAAGRAIYIGQENIEGVDKNGNLLIWKAKYLENQLAHVLYRRAYSVFKELEGIAGKTMKDLTVKKPVEKEKPAQAVQSTAPSSKIAKGEERIYRTLAELAGLLDVSEGTVTNRIKAKPALFADRRGTGKRNNPFGYLVGAEQMKALGYKS